MSCCDVAAETNADSDDMSRHLQTTQHVRRGPSTCCIVIVVWPRHVVHAVVVVDDEAFVYGQVTWTGDAPFWAIVTCSGR
jgi:hypothetical protein